MKVLGVDPGSSRTGFGLIEKTGQKFTLVETGVIEIREKDIGLKLVALSREFEALLARTAPDAIGMEKIFFSKNAKTAIEVAQARGVLMSLSLSAVGRDNLLEFTPQEVKRAVTNWGGAEKKAVARMVAMLLRVPQMKILDDATDALAVAITAGNIALKNP